MHRDTSVLHTSSVLFYKYGHKGNITPLAGQANEDGVPSSLANKFMEVSEKHISRYINMSSTALTKLASNLASKAKLLSELKKILLRPLVQLAVKSIEQEHIEDGILERIAEKYNVPQNKVDEWYAAVLMIIRTHLRAPNNSIKSTEFKQCLHELKFENECVDDLCAVLYGHKRPSMSASLMETTKIFPRVKKCLWRIDITISSSSLSRVLKPVILMEWILSTGERVIFELSLTKFHLIRYALASAILKIREVENTCALRNIQLS